MKIFIFGAGASQAAQSQETYTENHPERSPLVDALFNEQYKNIVTEVLNFNTDVCRKKVQEKGSLEKWLTEKWNAINTLNTERAKRAERSWFGKVNLYIWILLNRVSKTYPNAQGYSKLLEKLYDEDFGIISFNYDTLLDQSYEDVFSASLSSKKAYLDGNFVKLHGSVNWFLKKRDEDDYFPSSRHTGDIGVRIRAIAENIYTKPMNLSKLEILDPKHTKLSNIDNLMTYFNNEGYFYPLLFMPLTGKDYSIISDFKDVMITKAEEMLRSASDVYLIGYRASDLLIYQLLEQVPPKTKLHVIGMKTAESISQVVCSRIPKLEKGEINDQGFIKFIERYKIPPSR